MRSEPFSRFRRLRRLYTAWAQCSIRMEHRLLGALTSMLASGTWICSHSAHIRPMALRASVRSTSEVGRRARHWSHSCLEEGQEDGLRSGTLNVPGIVGFGKAVELALLSHVGENVRVGDLRDHLESRVLSEITGVQRNGALHQRLAGNSSFTFEDCEADALIVRMPHFGVSTGSACSSGAIEPSHVLTAIGRTRAEGHQTIRVGIGRFTDACEIDGFADALSKAAYDVRGVSVLAT